jgi:hypothetical protein
MILTFYINEGEDTEKYNKSIYSFSLSWASCAIIGVDGQLQGKYNGVMVSQYIWWKLRPRRVEVV